MLDALNTLITEIREAFINSFSPDNGGMLDVFSEPEIVGGASLDHNPYPRPVYVFHSTYGGPWGYKVSSLDGEVSISTYKCLAHHILYLPG